MSVLNDAQQGGDPFLVKQPFTAEVGTVPEMNLERTLPRQVSTGVSRGVQQLGSPNVFVDSGSNQIMVSDTVNQITTNRVLVGKQETFGEGFYVSKPGKDVAKITDSAELIFNSNQNVFKVVDSNSISFAVSNLATGATFTEPVAHGQKDVPAIIAFLNGSSSSYLTFGRYYAVPTTVPVAVGGVYQAGIQYSYQVDQTFIYFTVSNYTSLSPITDVGTATFKYYILQETAA